MQGERELPRLSRNCNMLGKQGSLCAVQTERGACCRAPAQSENSWSDRCCNPHVQQLCCTDVAGAAGSRSAILSMVSLNVCMQACISVNKAAGSVRLGTWRQFSYDHAFGPEAQQQEVYKGCVSSLVSSVLEGYNATVLAYGPTGSGKTHTMGMGSALHSMAEHHGIIPRVIRQVC